MKDISTREDLENLMADFYNRLFADDSINHIFTEIAKIDLREHLPHIVDFWEHNILHSADYRKNVLQIHLDLDAKKKLTPLHFQTWLSHFYATVDAHFLGDKSELMKTRATSVATVMKIKMQNRQ